MSRTGALPSFPPGEAPRFMSAEFGTVDSVGNWLNSISAFGNYKLISMTPVTATNHFSKEQETVVWVVAELQA